MAERGMDTTVRYQYRNRYGGAAPGYSGWTYTYKEDYEAKKVDPVNFDTREITGELRGGALNPLGGA